MERVSSDESGDPAPLRRPPTGELSDDDVNDDAEAASTRAGSKEGEGHANVVAELNGLITETKGKPDSNTAAAVTPAKTPSAKIYNADTGRFYTKSTADEAACFPLSASRVQRRAVFLVSAVDSTLASLAGCS